MDSVIKKKILLLGGTGVLSTDICAEAIKQGYSVYIITRGKRKQFINENAISITANIRKPLEIQEAIKNLHFDIVVDFLSFNTKDLQTTLFALGKSFDSFYYISSATAFENNGQTITETTPLNNRNWDYAMNKKECEDLLKNAARTNFFNYTIVRPYVTYGKTRIPFAIIPHDKQRTLINRMKYNKPIVLWFDSDVICPLTNTKDFAVAFVGLFSSKESNNNSFNIIGDEYLSWNEIFTDIKYASGYINAKSIFIPQSFIVKKMPELEGVLKGDKGCSWKFDNSKIKKTIKTFKTNIMFSQGINETINFYKNNQFMKKIDYCWDARIDNMVIAFLKREKNIVEIREFNKNNSQYLNTLSIKNRIIYNFYRYNFFYYQIKLLKRIKRILFNKR